MRMQLFHSVCEAERQSGKATRERRRERERAFIKDSTIFYVKCVSRSSTVNWKKEERYWNDERKHWTKLNGESTHMTTRKKRERERHATESTVHKIQSATFQRLTINNTCVYLSKHTDCGGMLVTMMMKKMPMKRSRTCTHISQWIHLAHTRTARHSATVSLFHNFLSFPDECIVLLCFVRWMRVLFSSRGATLLFVSFF